MTATFTAQNGADPVTEVRSLMTAALPTEGDLLYALQRQRTRILKRTAAGVDSDGASFAPYSPGYAKSKEKFGRSAGTVDLRGRNAPHMLQAIMATAGSLTDDGDSNTRAVNGSLAFYDERAALLAEVHNEGATIRTRLGYGGFEEASYGYKPRNARRLKAAKATLTMPRRHFFDASDQDVHEMENDMGARSEMRMRGRAA
jgi:hypothetical protein